MSAQTPTITGMGSGADFSPNVSTEGFLAVFGSGLAISETISPGAAYYPFLLGDTQAFACTVPDAGCRSIGVQYASPTQVNVVLNGIPGYDQLSKVPYYIKIRVGSVDSVPMPIIVRTFYPTLFFVKMECSSDYSIISSKPCPQLSRWAITNALSGRLIDSLSPAMEGSYVSIWLTGLGNATTLSNRSLSVSVIVKGYTVVPSYVGAVKGFAGLYQINFQIPESVAFGAPCGSNAEVDIRVAQGTPGNYAQESLSAYAYLPVMRSGCVL
jgi:uncharacterized protein (TIGR03437 family)